MNDTPNFEQLSERGLDRGRSRLTSGQIWPVHLGLTMIETYLEL